MLVDIKYAERDIVRFKFGHVVKSSCTCEFCGASGRVRGLDGTEEECPRCDGTGYMELRSYQQTEEENAIQEIHVNWDRTAAPKVSYVMSGWNWSRTEIPQEDIIRKVSESSSEI